MTVRYIGSHGDEFTGKSLSFEVIEDINETLRRVDLEVKNVSRSGKGKTTNIFYEFKSVKDVPPSHFLEQFCKDLMNPNVTDLSLLKWIFDGNKVTNEELSKAMKKVVDEWYVPKEITDIWIKDNYSLSQFKNDVLKIFTTK